jgi:hypothetical protein
MPYQRPGFKSTNSDTYIKYSTHQSSSKNTETTLLNIAPGMNLRLFHQTLHHSTITSRAVSFVAASTIQLNELSFQFIPRQIKRYLENTSVHISKDARLRQAVLVKPVDMY